MDAFYASVEQRDDPALRGKPVAVGGGPAGSAASSRRRATRRGRSASARRCRWRTPSGSVRTSSIVRPDFQKYRAVSQAVFEIFRAVTPLVEPLSLDEAYLDVTENAWGEPLGRDGRDAGSSSRSASATGADGVGRRGAEQVPREDCLGLEEAGRADGDRARAGRAVPHEAAGRRAVGRRAGDGAAPARPRYRAPDRRADGRARACCATRSAAT